MNMNSFHNYKIKIPNFKGSQNSEIRRSDYEIIKEISFDLYNASLCLWQALNACCCLICGYVVIKQCFSVSG